MTKVIFKIEQYVDEKGKAPFEQWIRTFAKDRATAGRLLGRVRRFENGNFGDHKGVGDGVIEHRADFGPGYRIYFGKFNNELVILLGGGDKSSQTNDNDLAKARWKRWKDENEKSLKKS